MIDIFNTIAPALGVIVPLIVAWAVRAGATADVKRVAAIAVTVAVAAISLAGADWDDITAAVVIERALVTMGEAQVVYTAATAAVKRWTSAGSLNALAVFAPGRGVG